MKPMLELVYQNEQGDIVHEKMPWYAGMKVKDVLNMPQFSHLNQRKMGVFSKMVTAESELFENDRLEFYLPLLICPKEARRLRAKKKPAN